MRRAAVPLLVATLALCGLVLAGCGASGATPVESTTAPSGPSAADKTDVNTRTREYVGSLYSCQLAVIAWGVVTSVESDPVALSDATSQAKAMCNDSSDAMLDANTSHFDDQADAAWTVVDTCKSGLGAFSDYLDTGAPSKAVSAQNKMAECNAWFAEALAGINQRRAVYDLPRLRESGKAVAAKKIAPSAAGSRRAVSCVVGKYVTDRTQGLMYNLRITMTAPREDNYMPRCGVADVTADLAWDHAGPGHTSTFNVGGARWNLGTVICIYRTPAGSDTIARCSHGTTIVTYAFHR